MRPFDSITFSKDFIDDVDTLLKAFNDVSKNKLFVDSLCKVTDVKRFMTKNLADPFDTREFSSKDVDSLGEHYPRWFLNLDIASVAQWIVSHFETRIFK